MNVKDHEKKMDCNLFVITNGEMPKTDLSHHFMRALRELPVEEQIDLQAGEQRDVLVEEPPEVLPADLNVDWHGKPNGLTAGSMCPTVMLTENDLNDFQGFIQRAYTMGLDKFGITKLVLPDGFFKQLLQAENFGELDRQIGKFITLDQHVESKNGGSLVIEMTETPKPPNEESGKDVDGQM